jgi:hypothetical protein
MPVKPELRALILAGVSVRWSILPITIFTGSRCLEHVLKRIEVAAEPAGSNACVNTSSSNDLPLLGWQRFYLTATTLQKVELRVFTKENVGRTCWL